MTNPTSNFGWQMPTPTDLVTDLPADFEVFGQAVDTSMADLKGGTTGQILSKATNADMDFTWITNDVGDITAVNVTSPITGGGTSGAVTIGVNAASTSASGVVQLSDSTSTTSSVLASTPTATKSAYDLANTANTAAGAAQTTANAAIPATTVTTAGDIIYRNSTVPTRLGIGTAGQVLQVNSGATAPEWTTLAASGALTKIATGTFNTVANTGTTFDGVFTSTYSNYVVVITSQSSTVDYLRWQFRFGGTPTTRTTSYFGATRFDKFTGGVDEQNANNGASCVINYPGTYVGYNTVNVSGVGNTSERAFIYGNGYATAISSSTTFGYQQDTSATYTGFILSAATGTITGTATVYGLAK